MNEQTERYVKLLKKNLDRVVIGVLYLFLLALAGVWYLEQGGADEEPASGTPASVPDNIENNPFWKSVKTMAAPQKMEAYPGIQQIRQYNMFDYKSVRQAEDLLRNLNQQFTRAQELEKSGQKDQAIALLKQILQQKPTYRPARDLLDKLEPPGASQPGAGAAATPAPGV